MCSEVWIIQEHNVDCKRKKHFLPFIIESFTHTRKLVTIDPTQSAL